MFPCVPRGRMLDSRVHGLVSPLRAGRAPGKQGPRRPVGEVRGVSRNALPQGTGAQPLRLPALRSPSPRLGAHAAVPALRRGNLERGLREHFLHRSPGVRGLQTVRAAPARPSGQRRPLRCPPRRNGQTRGDPHRDRRHGVRLHGRLDGLGRGREADSRDRALRSRAGCRSSWFRARAAPACRRGSSR